MKAIEESILVCGQSTVHENEREGVSQCVEAKTNAFLQWKKV